jgi:hypothetical protein
MLTLWGVCMVIPKYQHLLGIHNDHMFRWNKILHIFDNKRKYNYVKVKIVQ